MGLDIQDAPSTPAGSDLIDANCCEISSGLCPGSSFKAAFPSSLSVPVGLLLSDISALTLKGRHDTCALRSISRGGWTSSFVKSLLLPPPGEDMLSFSIISSQRAHHVLSQSYNNHFYILAKLELEKLWEGLGTFSQWCVLISEVRGKLGIGWCFRGSLWCHTLNLNGKKGFITITGSNNCLYETKSMWTILCVELMHNSSSPVSVVLCIKTPIIHVYQSKVKLFPILQLGWWLGLAVFRASEATGWKALVTSEELHFHLRSADRAPNSSPNCASNHTGNQ